MDLHTFTCNGLERQIHLKRSEGRDERRQWNNDPACYNRGFSDYFFHQAPLAEAEAGSAPGGRDRP